MSSPNTFKIELANTLDEWRVSYNDYIDYVDLSFSSLTAEDFSNITEDGLALLTSSDANPFTNADEAKLDGIEAGATANPSASEITDITSDGIALITSSDANPFTNADEAKLDGIEANATIDQTAQEIATLIDADPTAETTLKNALSLGSAAYTNTTAYDAAGTSNTHAGDTTTHGATGAVVGLTNTQTLTNKTITGTKETVYTISDGASVDIDPANGGLQTWVLGGNRTPTANNFSNGESVKLRISDGSAYTITWTTIGVVWMYSITPTLATTGYTHIELWKEGGVIYGVHIGDTAT